MRTLCMGDAVSDTGVEYVCRVLPTMIRELKADFVIINAENSNPRNGITKDEAQRLRYCGADAITTGNHAFRQRASYDFFDSCEYLLRPANFSDSAPGRGWQTFDTPFGDVCVVNLIGQIYMDNSADNPFRTADRILRQVEAKYIFVDFHAEATSEKKAMGYWLDGRVSCVFGTHTHVQTADERILPRGTAYITDVGMCGAADSVLGARKGQIMDKFVRNVSSPYTPAAEEPMINAILTDTDAATVQRIYK